MARRWVIGRNLVVFSDGTGNQLKAKGNTNVLRLHAMTRETPEQVRFYDPGVGTEAAPQALTWIGRTWTRLLGLAFGYGIKRNVVEAYTFIMRHWEPGDRIFLFGFSRGAYTVRAVAGMLRVIGLLPPDQENLVPYALKLFWKPHGKDIEWDHVKAWNQQFCRADFNQWGYPVEFLGSWDTVKSVGWFRRRIQLPYTRLLKSVRTTRHACGLDEWRGQYKSYRISEDEAAKPNRDMREVWFAGVHSDVGGTFEPEHDLADITLGWIGSAARAAGLDVDDDALEPYLTLPGDHAHGEVHRMGWFWVLTGISRRTAEPPGATVHESVRLRIAVDPKAAKRYATKGILDTNPVEPWPHG
ncbi:MAG: DUF2235 domain-containing protein [Acidimicrobiia bacterium]